MKYGIEELREHLACFCSCQRWREFAEVLDLLVEAKNVLRPIADGYADDRYGDKARGFLAKLMAVKS